MEQEIRQIMEDFILINTKETEKNGFQIFEGKMCKKVCFCAEITRFCRTGEATIYELLLSTKYKSKQTQLLAKISRSDV